LENLDERIAEVKKKIADVKKRWPFHSAKPAQYQELEDLEQELETLEELKRQRKTRQ